MRVKIDVTEEDIRCGKKCDATTCAVALACLRKLKGFDSCYIVIVGDGFEIDTPKPVYHWMRDFDLGKPVKPFSFTIDVPAKFVKPAKRKAAK